MDKNEYREIKNALDNLRVIRKLHKAHMDNATERGELVWGNNPHQRDLDAAIQVIIDNGVPWLDVLLSDNLLLHLEKDEPKS